jgi:methyltransferase (TIGR00027 family)
MRAGRCSQTAEYIAFYRALESARPPGRRLFADPLAVRFLRPSLRAAVALSRVPLLGGMVPWLADRAMPGARTSGIARTRLIDDAVGQALRGGIAQVVFLGAGFDCRAYRLPGIAAAAVFEVDHPATLPEKRSRLGRALGTLPEHVHFVEMDFGRRSLADALATAGLDARRPVVFVWEGVTNYLTADAVDAVLRVVAACAPGSRLVFTYVDRRALDGSATFGDAGALLRRVDALGEPWTFGIVPGDLPGYLQARGLRLDRDAGAREYRAECFGEGGERMKGYDFYHVAIAHLEKASDA